MRQEPKAMKRKSGRMLLFGAGLLAIALAGFLWAITYFGAEARVLRSTAQVVRLAEKTGEESPVSLGLSANRFGKHLATNAVLEVEGWGPLATGRTEIVQLFAQIRSSLTQIEFAHPEIRIVGTGKGVLEVRVAARYRFAPDAGDAAEGDGTADLIWTRGEDGWQIEHASLHAAQGAPLPGGWK